MFGFLDHDNHLRQSIIGQFHHEMNVLILLLCEILIGLTLPADGTCQVIATVTNTFNLSYLTKHGTYLKLTFRAQTPFRYLIQVIGNLQFHIITDILVFLNPAEKFIEVIILFSMQQILYHTKHTMNTLGKQMNLLTGLKYG